MSQTFSLVCHETKRRIWIGQGWGQMESLYSGEPKTMDHLRQFLNDHIGRPLEFVCNDRQGEDFFAYTEPDEAEPVEIPCDGLENAPNRPD